MAGRLPFSEFFSILRDISRHVSIRSSLESKDKSELFATVATVLSCSAAVASYLVINSQQKSVEKKFEKLSIPLKASLEEKKRLLLEQQRLLGGGDGSGGDNESNLSKRKKGSFDWTMMIAGISLFCTVYLIGVNRGYKSTMNKYHPSRMNQQHLFSNNNKMDSSSSKNGNPRVNKYQSKLKDFDDFKVL